ncbi:hypothetical protein RN001_002124 [Aquatica leii]|uniref:Uncharacterized protein n=1 Tax=Aquatica leii TaxID=1421715 RepID=A0AAN7SR47_9COLE|nr:hypothetical protein RN001_002124 [Aquatica leii]
MKIVIYSIVIGLIGSSLEQTQEEMTKYVNQCIESTKVSPRLVQKALVEGSFVNDQNLKCFLKCLFVSMGDMDETGEMMVDMLKAQAPKHLNDTQVDEIVLKCKQLGGSDACDIAYNVAECIITETTKISPTEN